ncbi:MAG: hypothetical protein MH321_14835 [Leptospiraceae bacterium]|nr:hypothetical protein [Leptospiraceae bacterium]
MNNMKNKKHLQLTTILILIFTMMQCRSSELDAGGASDVLRNPVSLLLGLVGRSFGGAGNELPRGFRLSGGSLFAVGYSNSVFETTDGNSFSRKSFSLPNCISNFSGNSFTICGVFSIAKSGSNYYAIALKQVGTRNSGSPSTISERKYYFGSGNSLDAIQFNEITDGNISSTSTNEINFILPSAASANGFVFSFPDSSSSTKVCATLNNGSSWVCSSLPTSGSSLPPGIEILNGTLTVDVYFRWNGSFTAVTTTNQGARNSIVFRSARTHFASGNQLSYTDTDPGAWTNPVPTTNSVVSSPISSGQYTILGDVAGNLSAIGSDFVSGTSTSYYFNSTNNGVNWSRQNTISIPSGLSISGTSGAINNTVFLYAQTNSGTFSQKYFKSSNFTEWAEFTP